MKDYGFDFRWLSVASFEMRFGDFTIVTDPYITDCSTTDLTWESVEACNLICVSHMHWDHVTDIPALAEKFEPLIMLGALSALPMARWINYSPSKMLPMYPDLELDFGAVKVRALYGRHIKLKGGINDLTERITSGAIMQKYPGMDALQELGSMEYCNYLFTMPNGTKVLIWGNEVNDMQINLMKKYQPDIAIIQRSVSEDAYKEKARFAAEIGAKVLIPHHHDFRGPEKEGVIEGFGKAFLELVPDGKFIAPDHGEWVHV